MSHVSDPSRWRVSRRTLLRGVGASLGLPLLEAMRPWARAATPPEDASPRRPVRLAFLYMANGVNPSTWTPEGTGRDFRLSPALEPLAPLRNELLVLTDLWNAATNTGDGHYVKTAGWLTGTTISKTSGDDIRSNGISVDQHVAQRMGHFTPLPSLELGIEPVTTGVDVNVGYTRLYGSHIAWSSPTTPVAKEINPRLAFDRLFRSSTVSRHSDPERDRSVLDAVLGDARRLRDRVGQADRLKLDEYLDSVRAVEKRIEFETRRQRENVLADPLARAEIDRLDARLRDVYADPARVSERHGDHTEHCRLMFDLLALAFWTDSTRVSTFMFGNAVSGRNFSFLDPALGGHHQTSHHENDKEKLAQYTRINAWHVAQYAYFLDRLRGLREGESSLLDQCLVVFGAGLRDGNRHDPHNVPTLLAGRGGGSVSPGRHLVFPKDTPLANLHLALLRRAGVPAERFADSTSELAGLAG
jgi:hypothetical protein